jgi:hypothetical protein
MLDSFDAIRGDSEWRDGSQRGDGIVFHQFCSPTDESDKAGEK